MITVGLNSPTTRVFLQRRQQFGQHVDQQGLDRGWVLGLGLLDPLAQGVEQVLGGLDAGVGQHQGRLQFLVQRLVDRGAGEDRRDTAAGAAQSGAQPAGPGGPCRHRNRRSSPSGPESMRACPGSENRIDPVRTTAGGSVSGAMVVASGTTVLSGSGWAGGVFFRKKLNICGACGVTAFYETFADLLFWLSALLARPRLRLWRQQSASSPVDPQFTLANGMEVIVQPRTPCARPRSTCCGCGWARWTRSTALRAWPMCSST